jgi:hypothetical protein
MIAARHAKMAEEELRKERQVEADEDVTAATFANGSGYMRPVTFGHQK